MKEREAGYSSSEIRQKLALLSSEAWRVCRHLWSVGCAMCMQMVACRRSPEQKAVPIGVWAMAG